MQNLDNQIYYFRVGAGEWAGKFTLSLSDWKAFWRDRIGFWNRCLTLWMVLITKSLGPSRIMSTLRAYPGWGRAGVATNAVRITKLGLTLYLLDEQYVLHPNGTDVYVHSQERFGPIPFLFRSTKRYPARIHKHGSGATYLDMPLLGSQWQGNYRVLDDRDHIDAELMCAWAYAKEIIARASLGESRTRQAIDAVQAVAPALPTDVSGVIERLRTYRAWYEIARDPRAVFTHAYLTITQIFHERIPQAQFDDPNWIVALDVAFANQYFRALEAFDHGEAVSEGWQVVFDAIRTGRTSVLEELVLSMAAHIVHDLPLALVEVDLGIDGGESRIRDFHRANDILKFGIDKIQRTVSRRYNPFLARLDRLSGRQDEILTDYGIRIARAVAWFNAERLKTPEGKGETLGSIGRSIRVIVRQVLSPPWYTIAIALRFTRWLSRLTRTWPRPCSS